jgi:hypothetical protein
VEKHQQNQKFIHSSLALDMIRLMLRTLLIYNMGDKHEHECSILIVAKRVELLNQWKDCISLCNVSKLYDYDYHLLEIR